MLTIEEGSKERLELMTDGTDLPSNGKDDKPQTNWDNEQKKQRLKLLLTQARKYAEFLVEQLQRPTTVIATKGRNKKSMPATRVIPKKALESEEFKQPTIMTGGRLRSYQLEGVQWLISLYENGLNGILADDMGLGKTVQSIGFLAFLREQGIMGPFLIVAPLSTLPNWVMEMQRFVPKLPVLMYHGNKDERNQLRKQHHLGGDSTKIPAVIVTSYELAMKDAHYLAPIPWKYMIIDEGHRLKNLNCRLIRELRAYNSTNRLLLTGTPIHNNLTELWSLLNFLLPQIFTNLEEFLGWFDIDVELTEEVDRQEMVEHLHAILKPMVLRRLKGDVEKELPLKRELLVYAQLTSRQRDYYQKVLEGRTRELVQGHPNHNKESNKRRKSRAKARALSLDVDSELDEDSSSEEQQELSSVSAVQGLQNQLMQLRKVCNHPYLFSYPVDAKDSNYLRIDEELVEVSGKMRLLDQLLPELIHQGHKILVFSQMTHMLDILEDYVHRLRGHQFCRIDGSVGMRERQEQVQKFNTNPKVPIFLLSTRAGGLGLNLAAADTVIFYDSDWNPQMDLQAQDRVHRIGQTRPVLVLRLATAHSIEVRMLERAASKRKLERLVMHKRKFKGTRQLLEDDCLLAGELQEILRDEQEKAMIAAEHEANSKHDMKGRGIGPLKPSELKAVLDRSEKPSEIPSNQVACNIASPTLLFTTD